MNKNEYKSYIKTFFLTVSGIFICIFILFGVVQNQIYNEQIEKQKEENTIDYYMIGYLIDKNKGMLQKDPSNYKINFRLGILYELKKDYLNAEMQYKEAMRKAPYDEFKTQYRLALFYITQNRLEEAEDLITKLSDKPNKELIKNKGDIYIKLGDKYYNKSDYENAGDKYKKALFYYSKIKSDRIKYIKDSIASSYVYLADQKVYKMQIQEAIDSLNETLEIVNAPIIKYKLAILLMKKNPELSCKYFEEVFQKEPSIIDYETYYAFLGQLANQAEAQGYKAKADLLRFRIKKLKEYYTRNILSLEDLSVEAEEGKIKLNTWTRKYTIVLDFRFKNMSEYPMESLFVNVVFKDGNKIIDEYFKQIADKDSALKAFAYSPIISLKTQEEKTAKDSSPKKITAEIYAAKTENAYRLFLKQVEIVEETKQKSSNQDFFSAFKKFWRKVFS